METVDFCKLPNKKLIQLIHLISTPEVIEIIEKSSMEEKYKDGICIEKSWEWYNTLKVTPTAITVTGQVTSYLLTAEECAKMNNVIKLLS
ncbi:MAG: hypothetical protein IM618_11190 [Cytophagales bacterium]|jgi:hypothetical protein|nr:hypothetical protein [Cytophagales bacterium]